jgi:predicted O-methyltransferase YrrM
MNRYKVTPPNTNTVTSRYKRPIIDRLLGKTTLEWKCDDGHDETISASLRFTDYEGNLPSIYSVLRLPYIMKTYIESKHTAIMSTPVPFLVMDAIKFLDKIFRPGMKVLELGGGNSSLWFLERGANLTTYEHSADWGTYLTSRINSKPEFYYTGKMNLKIMQGEETVRDLESHDDHTFDIILVDSMNDFTRRNDCMRAAMKKVKKGGWLILDNSDNPVNWRGADLLNGKDMIKFTGYSPMSLFVCQTTIWKM